MRATLQGPLRSHLSRPVPCLRRHRHRCAQPLGPILTLPLAVTIRYGVVAREEVYLKLRFGEAYRDYRTRARRWL